MEKDIAIVYLVAGLSKRFGGGIKAFAQIGPNDESLIEYSLNQALSAGFSKIYFIVGNTTEIAFKKRFKDFYRGIPVYYALQRYNPENRDKPWGTAEALSTLMGFIDCPFVICNGDNIYGKNTFTILAEHLGRSEEEATLSYKLGDTLNESPANRAIFRIQDGYVNSLKEMIGLEKAKLPQEICLGDLCSKNIFALHPKTAEMMYDKMQKFKKEHENNREIEYILPNALSVLLEEGKIKMKIYPAIEECLDVTMQEDIKKVRIKLKT